MLEMSLTRHELLLHVFYSLISWILLLLLEDLEVEVMLEVLVIGLSINFLLKWMVLELKRTFSLSGQLTDQKFLIRLLLDLEDSINLFIFLYQINLQDSES